MDSKPQQVVQDLEVAVHANDTLANERTYLAYVRTALAFIGFGFNGARPIGLKRLRAVSPPGVNAVSEQPFICLFPIQFTSPFLESVVSRQIAKQTALLLHLAPVVTPRIHVRPDGNHQA